MKLLISSICIVLAFFFGIAFSEQKSKKIIHSYESEKSFINIIIKKNKLSIDKNKQNIQVLVNWKNLNSEMTLENICY